MNPHFDHVMPLHRFQAISGSLRFVDALPPLGTPAPVGNDWHGQPVPTDPLYNRSFKVAPPLKSVLAATELLWNLGVDVSLDEMCVKSKGGQAGYCASQVLGLQSRELARQGLHRAVIVLQAAPLRRSTTRRSPSSIT
jgi:hypothetical protein